MVTDTDTETATATDTDTETDTATDTDTETATTTDTDTETATATKSTRICSGLPQTNSIHFHLKSYKFPEKNLFKHQASKAASEAASQQPATAYIVLAAVSPWLPGWEAS